MDEEVILVENSSRGEGSFSALSSLSRKVASIDEKVEKNGGAYREMVRRTCRGK